MKLCLSLAFTAIILLLSCKKEYSSESGINLVTPTAPGDSLLVKQLITTTNDSSVYLYTYDINKLIISQNYIDYPQGSAYHELFRLVRNGNGIITQEIIKDDSLLASGIDSLVYNVHYEQSVSRYTYIITATNLLGTQFKDSASFNYDMGGHITAVEHFYVSGSTFQPAYKTNYAYDATGSIVDEQQYNYSKNSNQYILISEDQFQYDLKINPLQYSIEAYLFEDPIRFSKYNITNEAFTDSNDPNNNFTLTQNYIYNSQNKPASSTGKDNLGSNYHYQYFYQ